MADPYQWCIYQEDPPNFMDIVVPKLDAQTWELNVDLRSLLTQTCSYVLAFEGGPEAPHYHMTSSLLVFVHQVGIS